MQIRSVKPHVGVALKKSPFTTTLELGPVFWAQVRTDHVYLFDDGRNQPARYVDDVRQRRWRGPVCNWGVRQNLVWLCGDDVDQESWRIQLWGKKKNRLSVINIYKSIFLPFLNIKAH